MNSPSIDSVLSRLTQIKKSADLDEFEQRALVLLETRLRAILKGTPIEPRQTGELARIVQEFDPAKLEPALGAQIISIEKAAST